MIYNFINSYKSTYKKLLINSYNDERKLFDKAVSLWVFYVTRPLSFLITPLFIILNFLPNHVTLVSLFLGFIALLFGISSNFLLSSVFYNLFLIFDSIDGNIARYLKLSSKRGEYLDAIVGDIINFLFLPSLGYGLYRESSLIYLDNNFIKDHIFSISILSSLIISMSILIAQRKKIIYQDFKKKPFRLKVSDRISKLELLFRNSFGFAFIAPISLILSFFGFLDFLIIYNLFISILVFMFIVKIQLNE